MESAHLGIGRRLETAARFGAENAFFEHLGLVGGFLLIAWLDLHGGEQ